MRPAFFSGIALAILLCSVQIVRAGDDAEKRKLEAQRLVERLGDLSDGERKRLIELKNEAFEPALKLVKELLPVCEKIPGRHLVHRCRCKVTGRFERALSLLKGVAKKEHAPVMVSLLQEPNSCLLGLFVLDWYYDKFGEEQCIPLVLRILQNDQSLKHIKSCTEAFCLFVLNNSTDRRAVEFFHKQIKDKNAVPLYRNMAFTNLARTGGKKGLETVLASRDKQRTTSVVRHAGFEKMGRYVQKDPREEHLSSMDVKLVDTRKDAAG
jgi:hypothetical protein